MRKWSTSVSMMFREFALHGRFAAARDAGFSGVEIQLLAEGEPNTMAQAARAACIDVVLINVGMGDYLAGGPGLSGVPGREADFRREVDQALTAALALNARFVHLGPSRVPQSEVRMHCVESYRSNIDYALTEHARRSVGGRLLIEPMNRVETPDALINDIDTGADFIRTHYAGALGLQFDIYHVAMNGADPVEAFARTADVAAHVQFSDMPGRQPPGGGTLDFGSIFEGIKRLGYGGWFGAEYLPRVPTLDTLGWMQRLG